MIELSTIEFAKDYLLWAEKALPKCSECGAYLSYPESYCFECGTVLNWYKYKHSITGSNIEGEIIEE